MSWLALSKVRNSKRPRDEQKARRTNSNMALLRQSPGADDIIQKDAWMGGEFSVASETWCEHFLLHPLDERG